ncbi:sigma-54-dependent transcriptional regulator [Desulfonatronum thiosulfatophilum]|nr:sigma-54 dependent transcriptional regulator [Desulfonatronum thiosulfatophilum]
MPQQQHILIIDDEVDMLQGLQRVLSFELESVTVSIVANPLEALELISKRNYELILLDVCMPEMNGMDLLVRIREIDPHVTMIMMTAYGSIETAVEAIRRGAYDFVTKPFEIPDLLRVLRKGLERNQLIRENLNLKAKVTQKNTFESFIGQTPTMRRLYDTIQALAHTNYTVLIRGQSGTGKELAARAIHDLSKRKAHPFFAVNCPAIPEQLLESELFGHKKGAFTGADTDYTGLFEEADGSTLLLDEIGDIPVSLQTKLLRVLQEQELRPLGGTRSKKINVRILASTNQDLEKKISERTFREDLFYRLNVVTVRTPTLREIRDDIPLLLDHLSKQFSAELEIPAKHFSLASAEMLMRRNWPGNIRELQNFVRRMLIFCKEEEIEPMHIQAVENPGTIPTLSEAFQICEMPTEPYIAARNKVLEQFTRSYVQNLLFTTNGNISRSAKMAGLSRVAMQKIMRRMDMQPLNFRNPERCPQ